MVLFTPGMYKAHAHRLPIAKSRIVCERDEQKLQNAYCMQESHICVQILGVSFLLPSSSSTAFFKSCSRGTVDIFDHLWQMVSPTWT